MTAPAGIDTSVRIGFRPCNYDPKVFSPRIRATLPARYLAGAGVRASVIPEDGSGQYDCVVFQKAYTKQDIELATRWSAQGAKLILDLCDNHFYNPRADRDLDLRTQRIQRMIDLVDAVTVSSVEIGKLIGGKPTFQVDDALERTPFARPAERLGRSLRSRRRRGGKPLRLVWHGQSGAEHLQSGLWPLTRILADIGEVHGGTPLSLTVVGSQQAPYEELIAPAPFPTRFIQWREKTFAPYFAQNDVCVLPIERNEFTVCKTNNRAVAAFTLGVPVIVDDIPSYHDLDPWIRFGDWKSNISAYARDPERADRDVEGAQKLIARTYTEDHVVDQWTRAVRAVLDEA